MKERELKIKYNEIVKDANKSWNLINSSSSDRIKKNEEFVKMLESAKKTEELITRIELITSVKTSSYEVLNGFNIITKKGEK